MDRKEYIRNSCGITAKKITPYNRDMDKTPRISTAERKRMGLPPMPRRTTPLMTEQRDRLRSQNTKVLPSLKPKVQKTEQSTQTVSLPPLNFRNVAPAVDTNDIKLFDNLRGEARILRVANSKTIQDAKEENKTFNYRYIKNLRKNTPF